MRAPEYIPKESPAQVEKKEAFPHLDMELVWSKEGKLQFQVHLKPGQQLKCLNKGSTHTGACFKAIPAGVCQRLAKLTALTDDNKNKSLDEIYPKHHSVLREAGPLTSKTPTPQEELERQSKVRDETDPSTAKNIRAAKQRERNRSRSTFFCVGYSKAWKKPIHKTINEIKKKFNLGWLRISMSYHRFTNLREIFQGDLSMKLTMDVESKDFQPLECNCRLGKGKGCGYNNVCRDSIVVYQVECKNTGKVHMGNAQQHFKNRMQQHFNDVKRLHQLGEKSDSHAKHFSHQHHCGVCVLTPLWHLRVAGRCHCGIFV